MPTPDRKLIAVVDDDPAVAHLLRGMLDRSHCYLVSANTGAAGLDLIRARRPDVVLLDSTLPDAHASEVLRQIVRIDPDVPVLFMQTGTGGPAAIEAAKHGAFDFLTKPLDPEFVRAAVSRAVDSRARSGQRVAKADKGDVERAPVQDLVGGTPAMLDVFRSAGRFAQSNAPVLLIGEPGAGKESIALQIHHHSDDRPGRFLTLHCPAYDEIRLREALFGSELQPESLWAQAAGGTLLLQEIRALPLALQTELVSRLEAAESNGALRASHPRVIASDSVGLQARVKSGAFRSDLYYLLSTCEILIPPLRERRDDLPEIVRRFLAMDDRRQSAGDESGLTDEAWTLLYEQIWPGNLDELQGVLRRASIETGGPVIDATAVRSALVRRAIPPNDAATKSESDWFVTNWRRFVDERLAAGTHELYSECLAEAERKLLVRLLEHTRGNQSKAARMLGISRASLRKKLRAHEDAFQADP